VTLQAISGQTHLNPNSKENAPLRRVSLSDRLKLVVFFCEKGGFYEKGMILTGIIAAIFILAGQASAHFGMVIPSDSMVMQGENKDVTVTLSFSHPFEGHGMELVTPVAFGVMANGNKQNLHANPKKPRLWGIRPGNWVTLTYKNFLSSSEAISRSFYKLGS
jgi:hypothetical protein